MATTSWELLIRQDGEEMVASIEYANGLHYQHAEEVARAYLSQKAASHESRGWLVVWSGLDAFAATKTILPSGLLRTRLISIRAL